MKECRKWSCREVDDWLVPSIGPLVAGGGGGKECGPPVRDSKVSFQLRIESMISRLICFSSISLLNSLPSEELDQQFRGARSFKSKSLARELWNRNMNIHIGSIIRFAR